QMLLEVGVFATATALAAKFSAEAVAAHQIVLNAASMTFMVPLGISSATGVLVGQAMGARDYVQARAFGWQGLRFGVGFMTCTAVVLLSFPDLIIGAYTHDLAVIEAAKKRL